MNARLIHALFLIAAGSSVVLASDAAAQRGRPTTQPGDAIFLPGDSITPTGEVATQPGEVATPIGEPPTLPALDVDSICSTLGKKGGFHDGVLTIAVPRDDLRLMIDGMPVPTGAGLSSHIWFYRCPCGRTRMIGEFIVCDYEADDVARAIDDNSSPGAGDADVRVDAIASMLSGEKPAMRIVRVHGEGTPQALAARVAAAFDYIGDARNRKSTTMPTKKSNSAKQ